MGIKRVLKLKQKQNRNEFLNRAGIYMNKNRN